MKELTISLLKSHNILVEDMEKLLTMPEALIFFKEYEDFGFVSLVRTQEYDVLVSAGVDNIYSFSMWRDIRKLLKTRTRPIMASYGANLERLLEASERYTYERVSDNVVIFI